MNNVAYALYFNFWFVISWMLEMKEGHWIYGYGTMAVGILICYFLDEIVELVKRLPF